MARATGGPLTYVTRSEWAPLVQRHPAVAEVLTLPARGQDLRGAVGKLAAEINERVRPAAVLDWHGVPLARRIAAAVKAPVKVTYPKYALARWLLATFGLDALPAEGIRVPALYTQTAARWGTVEPDYESRLAVNAGVRSKLHTTLGLEDGMTAFAPGARHAAKMWPLEHGRALVKLLGETGRKVLLLGSAEERGRCEEIAAGATGVVNAAGACEVAELPELLAGAAALVTNDSAFAHLAPLVGVPVVDLFGPTSPRFGFAPRGACDRVLYLGMPCSPCSKHGARPCWRARRACLEDIRPAEVFAAAAAAGGWA